MWDPITIGGGLAVLLLVLILTLRKRRRPKLRSNAAPATSFTQTTAKIRGVRDWLLENTPPGVLVSGANAAARYFLGYLDATASVIAKADGYDPDSIGIRQVAAMEAHRMLGDPSMRDALLEEGMQVLAHALESSQGQEGRSDGFADAAEAAGSTDPAVRHARYAKHYDFSFTVGAVGTDDAG